MRRIAVLSVVLLMTASLGLADHGEKKAAKKESGPTHGLFRVGDESWGPVPDALPAGAQVAVLEGNPFGTGLYTMRLSMPSGYRIPPHWHLKWEHVTVISGTFHLGMGEKFDQSAGHAMPPGTFGFLAPNMNHYAWASEPTVIQLHGEGPWGIYYVNAADDPRKPR